MNQRTYVLESVVMHYGDTPYSGHYTALCRADGGSFETTEWFECDDSSVKKIENVTNVLSSSSAYLLFYKLSTESKSLKPPPPVIHSSSYPLESDKPQVEVLSCLSEMHLKVSASNSSVITQSCHPDGDIIAPLEENTVPDVTMGGVDEEINTLSKNISDVSIKPNFTAPRKRPCKVLKHQESRYSKQRRLNDLLHEINNRKTGQGSVIEPCCPDPSIDEIHPILNVSDIPKAHITSDRLPKAKKDELIWWLKCRGLPTNGLRKDLLQRVENHIKMGKGNVIDPKVDGGKFLKIKQEGILRLKGSIHKAPLVPVQGWKKYSGKITPQFFNFGCLINYILERAMHVYDNTVDGGDPESDDESLSRTASKSVPNPIKRGIQFLTSESIDEVWEQSKGNHYFVKASVSPSMTGPRHTVTVTMSNSSGYICEATCSPCKQEDTARCSHICAVLLLLVRYGVDSDSEGKRTTTDRPQYWGKGGMKRLPGVFIEKQYYEGINVQQRASVDPRGTAFQNGPKLDDFVKLKEALSHNNAAFCRQIEEYLLPPESQELSDKEIALKCVQYLEALKSSCYKNAPTEVPATLQQSNSDAWHLHRAVRATASEAKTILGFLSNKSTDKGKMNFLRRHMWGLQDLDGLQSVEYGRKNEDIARGDYLTTMQESCPDVKIIQTGMWVNPKYPQLSCSPDGLIEKPQSSLQLLEIKCPLTMQYFHPSEFDKKLTTDQIKRCFLKRNADNSISLKSTSRYFYQVQMSLDILELSECQFAVWSPKGLIVLPILYDRLFWETKRNDLLKVHRQLLFPEYFLRRTLKGLPPKQITY